MEDNTTAFLVRSTSEEWKRGSVLAVDAGVHLSAISAILDQYLPAERNPSEKYTISTGPFTGLELPYVSAKANAAHFTRTIVDTYLITHPHLDHISGLVVNTAALPGTRPKRIAALPSTISAFKHHIFNNVIWPNLSDENDGAGLVTYMRLVEGGSSALGTAEAKGYVEISEGLCVKTWSVSHGHCMENHWHRGSSVGLHAHDYHESSPMRRSSNPMSASGFGHNSPRPYYSSHVPTQEDICVYDSCAYFIRDIPTGTEVLIFGDVEPDSISLSPRNQQVWSDAAPKIVNGSLKAIFIECSYDDSQSDDTLFGHLAPRFLIEELVALARQVALTRAAKRTMATEAANLSPSDQRKRKRISASFPHGSTGSFARMEPEPDMPSPMSMQTPEPQGRDGAAGEGREREAVKRPHRRSNSSVSPHSRTPNQPARLGSMQMDGHELDERGPLRPVARLIEEPVEFEPTSAPFPRLSEDVRPAIVGASEGLEQEGEGRGDAGADGNDGAKSPLPRISTVGMLQGLKVVIIHVKDRLDDGESAGEKILREVREYEAEEGLGCEFSIAERGMSVLF